MSRAQASDKKSQGRLDVGRELLGRTKKLALAGTKARTIYLVYSWETWCDRGVCTLVWPGSFPVPVLHRRKVGAIQYELHGMGENTTLSPLQVKLLAKSQWRQVADAPIERACMRTQPWPEERLKDPVGGTGGGWRTDARQGSALQA